jgi:hypothetical protein
MVYLMNIAKLPVVVVVIRAVWSTCRWLSNKLTRRAIVFPQG